MPELHEVFTRSKKWMFYLLAIYVLGWGFTSFQSVFLGLIFGTGLSLFNLWLMVRKTEQFGEKVLKGQNVRSLGTFSRMASGALAVIVALRYPEYLNIIAIVLGLMTSYIVIMIDFFIHTLKINK
ncbi:ATP synthase subunit I [Neobacillus kokaensis]|uniref:ATP synthase protein I n=1 Tax=Neobacillus kokaensis TaxID=2759023 RepID=A0ABQ3N5N1_9BACI|nr:ATP synthase subunit I [Neobacillus kokaensis]GHH98808.1 ATP synthase protein I [Neobacillus kokaensis]